MSRISTELPELPELPDLAGEPRPKFKKRLWLHWLADQDEFPAEVDREAKYLTQDIENMIADAHRKNGAAEYHARTVAKQFAKFSEVWTLHQGAGGGG